MSKLSDNLRSQIQSRINAAQQTLVETGEWIDKLKSAGFTVSELEVKQSLQEGELERLRMLL